MSSSGGGLSIFTFLNCLRLESRTLIISTDQSFVIKCMNLLCSFCAIYFSSIDNVSLLIASDNSIPAHTLRDLKILLGTLPTPHSPLFSSYLLQFFMASHKQSKFLSFKQSFKQVIEGLSFFILNTKSPKVLILQTHSSCGCHSYGIFETFAHIPK